MPCSPPRPPSKRRSSRPSPRSTGCAGGNPTGSTSSSPGRISRASSRAPCFDAAGNLWVVDIPWGRLFKITPAGEVSLEVEYDGHPNGLKFMDDGRAYIAESKSGTVLTAEMPVAGRKLYSRDC